MNTTAPQSSSQRSPYRPDRAELVPDSVPGLSWHFTDKTTDEEKKAENGNLYQSVPIHLRASLSPACGEHDICDRAFKVA